MQKSLRYPTCGTFRRDFIIFSINSVLLNELAGMALEEIDLGFKEFQLMGCFARKKLFKAVKDIVPVPEFIADVKIISYHFRSDGSKGVEKNGSCLYHMESIYQILSAKLIIICLVSLGFCL